MAFPISTIKVCGCTEHFGIDVETMDIDVDSVWMRARNVIAVNSANSAEMVFREMGAECVGLNMFLTRCELKVFSGYNEVPKTFLSANATVALQGF